MSSSQDRCTWAIEKISEILLCVPEAKRHKVCVEVFQKLTHHADRSRYKQEFIVNTDNEKSLALRYLDYVVDKEVQRLAEAIGYTPKEKGKNGSRTESRSTEKSTKKAPAPSK
jgi:hypothetical protein